MFKNKQACKFIFLVTALLTGKVCGNTQMYLLHDTMEKKIGYPAVIEPGGEYPSIEIISEQKGVLKGEIIREDIRQVVQVIDPRSIDARQVVNVTFPGTPSRGRYRIQFRIMDGNQIVFKDAFYFSVFDPTQLADHYSVAAHPGQDGRLVYTPDFRGNRIPDFSGVGYRRGKDIPDVPVKISLSPDKGDDTRRIQDAIDAVSAMEQDADGFRGAVLLRKGIYEISGTLAIKESGVVVRGEGQGDPQKLWLNPANNYSLDQLKTALANCDATILIATGSQRRRLMTISGVSGVSGQMSTRSEIIDNYVPVGATAFGVENPGHFSVGDKIVIERRSNSDWITAIGMDAIPPRPDGSRIRQWTPINLEFEHVVASIDGNRIHIDSSIVNAIEKQWGGGQIYKYTDTGRISDSGIEQLRAISFWRMNADGVDDTRHPDRFLLLDNIRDGWVRNITVEHFSSTSGAITTGRASLGITIQDSSTLIADRDFYRGRGYDSSGRTFRETGVYVGRYGFHLMGQNALVRMCYALNNRHAFALGSRVTGPNAFVHCIAENSLTYSEPHHRWSTGGLYDNVDDLIALMNRLHYGSGHGWAGANYAAWNTRGQLTCEQPPTAQNWAIGHSGEKRNGPFHRWNIETFGYSYGYWESHGQHVMPRSLYFQQLKERNEND